MEKRGNKPKLANCTPSDVFRALKKLGAFEIIEDGKHSKIVDIGSGRKSTIPRHNVVNRNLLKDFVEDFLVKQLGYTEKQVYKYLWC
ncbi:MAG: hypothetical protein Q8R40_05820 [bacterium]|nr:hypothetical protein [bacterium]